MPLSGTKNFEAAEALATMQSQLERRWADASASAASIHKWPTEKLADRMRAYGSAVTVGVFIGAAVTSGVIAGLLSLAALRSKELKSAAKEIKAQFRKVASSVRLVDDNALQDPPVSVEPEPTVGEIAALRSRVTALERDVAELKCRAR